MHKCLCLLLTNTVAVKRDLLAERTGLGKSVSVVSLRKNGPKTIDQIDFFEILETRIYFSSDFQNFFGFLKFRGNFFFLVYVPNFLKECQMSL